MYKISKNIRKFSSTPIVRPYLDDNGKEKEEMVCLCIGKKAEADVMALKIIKLLNEEESIVNNKFKLFYTKMNNLNNAMLERLNKRVTTDLNTCVTCRFDCDTHCNVGTYLAEQGKSGICYEGELWEEKIK